MTKRPFDAIHDNVYPALKRRRFDVDTSWECNNCTFINHSLINNCEVCEQSFSKPQSLILLDEMYAQSLITEQEYTQVDDDAKYALELSKQYKVEHERSQRPQKIVNFNNRWSFIDCKTKVNGFYRIKNFLTTEESDKLTKHIINKAFRALHGSVFYWYLEEKDKMKNDLYTKQFKEIMEYLSVKVSKFCEELIIQNEGDIKLKQETQQKFYDFAMKKRNQFETVLIRSYKQNEELPLHDDGAGFGEFIVGISLLGDSMMSFEHSKTGVVTKVYVPKLSLYFMSGTSRYEYHHGFAKDDIFDRRISMTYRYHPKPTKRARSYRC